MARFLEIKNWNTGEVYSRVDVTGRSERQIERIEMGMLMKCDTEKGWGVNDVTE